MTPGKTGVIPIISLQAEETKWSKNGYVCHLSTQKCWACNFRLSEITSGVFLDKYLTKKDICWAGLILQEGARI